MMDKIALMKVAAELTVAACAHPNDSLSKVIDPTIQDPQIRAKNLEVWEVFRIMYAAVQQAEADDKDWLPPVRPVMTPVPAPLPNPGQVPVLKVLEAAAQGALTGSVAGPAGAAVGALGGAVAGLSTGQK